MPSLELNLLAKDGASAAIKGMTSSVFSANIAFDLLKKAANFAAESIGNAVKSNEEYKKITDDTTKNVNALAMGLGSMLVMNLKSSITALRDFTGEEKNIRAIGGAFALIIEFGKRLITDVFDALKVALSPVVDLFKDFSKEGNAVEGAMKAIAVVMEIIKAALAILGGYLKMVIQYWIDWGKVIFEAGKTVAVFFELLTGKKNWDDVKKQAGETAEAFEKGLENLKKNGKAIIDETVKDFKEFNANTKKTTSDNLKIIEEGGNAALEETKKASAKIEAAEEEVRKKKAEADKKALLGESIKTFQQWSAAMVQIQQQTMATIQQSFDVTYGEALGTLSDWKDSALEEVDDWASQEEARMGVKESTDAERIQAEILGLQSSLSTKQTVEDKALAEQQIKEKQAELKRVQIRDEAAKRKEQIEKDAAKKETELKRQKLAESKAWAIANIWLNAAVAIMGWWASFSTMLLPGIVLAAIMTAATLTMAGVQCFSSNVLIKLITGKYKKAKDINIRDIICGDDDTPRIISDLYYGKADMYKVRYDNFEFECTYNHILSFFNNGKILNIELDKYLENKNKEYKLYRKINNEIKIIDNFKIEYSGKKEFYGFEIDGNHLFKIENDLVTHNTGLVASQTFHGKEGGLISKGQTTGDNAVLFANKGEALFQDSTYQNLVNQINGGGMGGETNNFNIGTLILQGVQDPLALATQLKDLQRYEKAR